jgi:hypothetical protein
MKQTSREIRHFMVLAILWLVFGGCVGFSNTKRALNWLPISTSQYQWTAVWAYITALAFVSLYHARSPEPSLRRLWLAIVITTAIFTFTACALQKPVYDDVMDRKESVTPMIVFGCIAGALGVASFPSSYLLWRKYDPWANR